MVGIAAYYGKNAGVIASLVGGLTARGDDAADWRAGRLGLAVRAGLPKVHSGPNRVSIVVDGMAWPGTVLARYAEQGAAGVLDAADPDSPEPEPYALALADPNRATMVLARSGAGPTLYYARRGNEVLAASEPAGLFAAGVPDTPDEDTIRRFLETGECDNDDRTFFAEVRQVLPGQVLEITRRSMIPVARVEPARELGSKTSTALERAARSGRLGVRLGDQVAGAALLAAVLTGPGHNAEDEPVPVYSTKVPDVPVSKESRYTGALVAGLGDVVRHDVIPLLPDELDDFLADVGEPVPDPDAVCTWRVARRVAGEVDALLDPVGVLDRLAGEDPPPYLARLADRIANRFGMTLRMPYREVPKTGDELFFDLVVFARDQLPAQGARRVGQLVPEDFTRYLLDVLRSEVYATFLSRAFGRRPWVSATEIVEGFGELLAGRRSDAGLFWRAFLVERWLRRLERGRRRMLALTRAPEPPPGPRFGPNPGREFAVTVAGTDWLRFPVRTPALVEGNAFGTVVGARVAELVAQARADERYRDRFDQPWYLLVAARPLAVAQGQVCPLWKLRPGRWARWLADFVPDRSWEGLGNPWTMQRALEEVGLRRLLLALGLSVGARTAHRRDVFLRWIGPAGRAVGGPVEGAVYPVNAAVSVEPRDPAGAAEEILAAVRTELSTEHTGLSAETAESLAGCAVVAGGRFGRRVLAAVGDRSADFFAAVCADDPWGARDAGTPVVVLVPAPVPAEPEPARRGMPEEWPAVAVHR